MAKTPNYSFERAERERQKAAKLAQKAEAKRRLRDADSAEQDAGPATPPKDRE